jgi:hypothetical protein
VEAVKDGSGRTLIYRVLTPEARPFVHPVPGRLVEERYVPGTEDARP